MSKRDAKAALYKQQGGYQVAKNTKTIQIYNDLVQDIKRTSKARWHHPNSEEDSEEKDGNEDRQEGLANIFKMSRQLIQPKQKKKKGGLER